MEDVEWFCPCPSSCIPNKKNPDCPFITVQGETEWPLFSLSRRVTTCTRSPIEIRSSRMYLVRRIKFRFRLVYRVSWAHPDQHQMEQETGRVRPVYWDLWSFWRHWEYRIRIVHWRYAPIGWLRWNDYQSVGRQYVVRQWDKEILIRLFRTSSPQNFLSDSVEVRVA